MGFTLTPELKRALEEDGVIKAEGLLVLRFFGDKTTYRPIPEGDGLFTVEQREKAGANVEDAMKEGDLFRHPGFLQLR